MTDNATPKTPRNYSRPTKFPAAIPRTMTTQAQRDKLDEIREKGGHGIGEIVRALLDDALMLIDVPVTTRLEVQRIAESAGVSEAEAMTRMLDFAARESRRRIERNGRISVGLARSFAAAGFEIDGVSVGDVDLSLDR